MVDDIELKKLSGLAAPAPGAEAKASTHGDAMGCAETTVSRHEAKKRLKVFMRSAGEV